MKILIINAYGRKRQADFKKFESLIKKAILQQNHFLDTETEFFTRTKDDLDDFLYEPESVHANLSSARMFNYVDIIFVEGDSNLRPWSQKARKVFKFNELI